MLRNVNTTGILFSIPAFSSSNPSPPDKNLWSIKERPYMKLNVTECRKSFKFTNMWVVTYTFTTEDFLTGEKTTVEYHMFSQVPVEPGLRTVVKAHNEDFTKFWIKEVKA